jgi:precorrin-6Y C5,15-methyltransferase (decarboxylating)
MHGSSWFGARAEHALRSAEVLVGAPRLLDALPADIPGERIALDRSLDVTIDLIDSRRARGQRVCQLASGDPGFFGIVRLLVGRFGHTVEIFPAPSSAALGFARAQVNWDDAVVVSAHGRAIDDAVSQLITAPKAAVLVSPDNPPEAIGQALLDAGVTDRRVTVCSHLEEPNESVTVTDLFGLAAGTFDPFSIVILTAEPIGQRTVRWGQPIGAFDRRDSMITKPELRAVALSKLALRSDMTMWDVGAASGSVGIESARLAPGLRVYAIEQHLEDCDRIRNNASDVAITVVNGRAPDAFDGLPTPDAIFVGGGGRPVFEASLTRLGPGGTIVATFAVMETALAAVELLDGMTANSGQLVQIAVNRSVPIGPQRARRLEADNPVFVVWGSPV